MLILICFSTDSVCNLVFKEHKKFWKYNLGKLLHIFNYNYKYIGFKY